MADIVEALQNLHNLLQREMDGSSIQEEQETEAGPGPGHPRTIIPEGKLRRLLEANVPVSCIARCLRVSRRTVHRRMQEIGLSVREMYISLTDQELDAIIEGIKMQMPNAGYKMVSGHLVSMGYRVQRWRIVASMRRVDAPGILLRILKLGCVNRRSYSVRGPLSLVHIDTNHKLIR